jgi:hypothetical protein
VYARGTSPTSQDKWVKSKPKPIETEKSRPYKPTIYIEPVLGKRAKREPVEPWKKRALVHMGTGFVPVPVILNRRKILDGVCREEDLCLAALLSKCRTPKLVRARWKAMYRLRELLNLSYPEIGRSLGMDHSTIIHGIKQYEKLLASGEA